MSTNILMGEKIYSCTPTTADELDEMLQSIYDSRSRHGKNLMHYLCRDHSTNIRWENIQHLRIVGDVDTGPWEKLISAGFNRGFYLNTYGNWLLILPDKSYIGYYINQCYECLKSLAIMNTHMNSLDLRKFTFLEEVYIEDHPHLTNIDFASPLKVLERLLFIKCPRLQNIPDLSKSVSLSRLVLINCTALTSLPLSENNSNLEVLDLYGCCGIKRVPYLDSMQQLTELNLSGCSSLNKLPSLNNLAKLTKLYLSSCTNLRRVPELHRLLQLKEFIIRNCFFIKQLPKLENLPMLTHIDFSGCANITLPPVIQNLPQLRHISLSNCTSLTLPPILKNLPCLESFDISGCSSIATVPEELAKCTHLQHLNLSRMTLHDLPDWLPDIAGSFEYSRITMKVPQKAHVSLFGTSVNCIQDMSIFDQSYEVVAEWFRKRKTGDLYPLNEIKVVFLGDGEAGKSHTIARLMNDGGDPDYAVFDGQSTPGIVIRNKDYDLIDYDLGDRKFQVHYWDFGGQEIMHSMHRIFLTGRTMYVILLNARDDTQGDRARYWLHNVKSFAPDSYVLLVLNKIDQNKNASVDEADLRSRYDKLTQVVRLSAKEFSQEKFNTSFTKVLLKEIQHTGYLDFPWPNAWRKVKEQLENMTPYYIMGDAYEAICEECQVTDNQKNLLNWFNDLGISFCCCEEEDYDLNDYVILRPDWITNALYIILFNKLEGAQNGLIPHKSIHNVLKNAYKNPEIRCTLPNAKYTSGDIHYVLGIMRRFNLSFSHGTEYEFIPMLCQQNSKADIQYYQKDTETLEFNMEFDYLPNNLLHRLMVERHGELDMDNVWRTGARFQIPELGYSAVVVIDGDTLRFFIRHSKEEHRPNTYLTMLKTNVDRIVTKMGLKPPVSQLIYKFEGKREEFEFDLLKEILAAGESTTFSRTHRKSIPILYILNQSAPDGLEDERKLLDSIIRSCQNIQGEPDYRLGDDGHGMEDKRNRRIRDDLYGWGYNIQDQTQRGRSGTGASVGELDFLLYNEKREPWTTIEALRVSNGTKTEWKKHLNKLVSNYNFFGARFLYLLTYVDADPTAFADIWTGYKSYIQTYDPGVHAYVAESFLDLSSTQEYTKAAKCQYTCGGNHITVYHIFARIPTSNE